MKNNKGRLTFLVGPRNWLSWAIYFAYRRVYSSSSSAWEGGFCWPSACQLLFCFTHRDLGLEDQTWPGVLPRLAGGARWRRRILYFDENVVSLFLTFYQRNLACRFPPPQHLYILVQRGVYPISAGALPQLAASSISSSSPLIH